MSATNYSPTLSGIADQSKVAKFIERPPVDIFSRTLEPLPDILPDIIARSSGLFVAPGDQGKTTQVSYFAMCFVLALPIFGRVPRSGKVLYVMGEDGTDDFCRTLTMIGANDSEFMNRADEIAERILILNQCNVPGNPRLVVEDRGGYYPGAWFGYIEDLLKGDPDIRMVILDTMSSLGMPESRAINDAPPIYHAAANALCQKYDVAFMATAHVGQTKAEGREIGMYSVRSGTSLADNARWVIQAQRHLPGVDDDKYPPPQPIGAAWVTRWHVLKKKFSPLRMNNPLWIYSDDWSFDTFPEHDHADLKKLIASQAERKDSNDEAIVAAEIEKLEVPTRSSVEASLRNKPNISRQRVRDAISRMLGRKDIEEVEGPKDGPGRRPKILKFARWKPTTGIDLGL